MDGVERLREHVMREGQQVLARDIYRGQMLVRPEEEWLRGYEALMRTRLIFDVFTFGALGSLMVFFAVVWAPVLGIIMIVCVGVVAMADLISYRASHEDLKGWGAKPGIYEHGLEMPMFPTYATRLFIPWGEMKDVWVRRSRMVDDVLFVSVAGSKWRWRFPGRLLGDDGIQEVLRRAGTPATLDLKEPEQDPPRLVIYSTAGAKTEVPPDDR